MQQVAQRHQVGADEWTWASKDLNAELATVQSILDKFLDGRETARALDAGCGSGRRLRIPADVQTVGIDISQRQLDRNQHLAERILGDLQTYPLPERSFDLVVCWEVLEHLAKPEAALRNMRRALKSDGLMILALPNLMSVKGLVTKFTPHAFHLWFYRRIYRSEKSGDDDGGPFPTFFRREISPKGIRRFAAANGLHVEHFGILESRMQRLVRLRYRITGRLWKAVRFAVRCVTIGRVDPKETELIVVLGGPELGSERAGQFADQRLGPA
jgi:SAM-dependent methyltransferase